MKLPPQPPEQDNPDTGGEFCEIHASRTRAGFFYMFVAGLFLTFGNLQFEPRGLLLLLIPVFVIAFSWFYLKATERGFVLLQRTMPVSCLENETISIELELCYKSPLPFATAWAVDSFPAVDIMSSPQMYLNNRDFSRSGRATISYTNPLNRGYGDFMIGPLEITVQDPFGFFESRLTLPLKTPLKVWLNPPAPDDLDLVKDNALTPMGDSRSSQTGHGMDFFGIKEYAPGDDIRAISWLKTAQTGRPVIKQFERDSRPDVLVVIHTDRQQLRGQGFGNSMKRLFRIAAAILSTTQQRGLPTAFVIGIDNQPQCLRLNTAVPVYGFMTELLASLQPAESETLQPLLDLSLSKTGPGSIVIFLSQTIQVPIEPVVHTLLTMQARGARVMFRAIDDSGQARFSEGQNVLLSREDLLKRLNELDLDFGLLPIKKEETTRMAGAQ